MRKAAATALGVTVVAGLLLLLVLGLTRERTLAFTLGAPAGAPLVVMAPGSTACQQPIPASAAFDEIELQVGTFGRRGPPLTVTVDEASGERLGRGEVAAGYGDVERPRVDVGEVPDGGSIVVCVTNEGRRRVALYGSIGAAVPSSGAELDGEPLDADVDLVFRTAEPRSTLSQLPQMLERASLFRGGWIGPWLYWLLFAAVIVGVPLLLWRSLRGALDAPDGNVDAQRDDSRR